MSKSKKVDVLNVMTQYRFNRLKPENTKIVLCPGNTDYTNIGNIKVKSNVFSYSFGDKCVFGDHMKFHGCTTFGEKCVFGNYCSFGSYSKFGDKCQFGEDCVFVNNCEILNYSSFGEFCSFGDYCSIGNCNVFGELCEFYRANIGNENDFSNYCLFKGCDIGKDSGFAVGCCLDSCYVEKRQVIGNKVYIVDGISEYRIVGIPVKNTVMIYLSGWSGTIGQLKKITKRSFNTFIKGREGNFFDKEELLSIIQLFEYSWKREKDANP